MRNTLARHHFWGYAFVVLIAVMQPVFCQERHPEEMQDEPWVAEVYCKGNPNKQRSGFIDTREYRLCFHISEDKLQPAADGKPNRSELSISSYTKKGQPNLTEMKIDRVLQDTYPGLILGNAIPAGPERSSNLSSLRVFKVAVAITDQSRTGGYPITVEMKSGTETSQQKVDFSLPILNANNTSVLVQPKNDSLVDCWAGSDCSGLELEVQNKIPYKISIENITISSGDLLWSKPKGDYQLKIDNSSPRDLNIVMQAKPLTFKRVFKGFGTPQIKMRIDYKDEYGRFFSTETPASLEIRPNLLVIMLFLVIGAAIGTLIKIYAEKSECKRLFSKPVLTTFASGIALCMLALFANIKLSVWNDSSFSAWDPKVLLITAVIATINGLPLIYAYFKVQKPAPESAPSKPKGDA